MKRETLVILFAGALVLALSTAGFAQAVPGGTPGREQGMEDKGIPASPDAKKATGEVISIDSKAGTLTLKAEGKEMKLDATGAAAKKSLADIKVGDKVIVQYSTGPKGQLVAQSVEKPGAERGEKSGAERSEKPGTERSTDRPDRPGSK
ncbi:MAG TPA: hypothetical protein VGR30_07895 [Candidatus Binatia bacterium]|nr:hypothetical protein [Candidatus Binatia bacterium]